MTPGFTPPQSSALRRAGAFLRHLQPGDALPSERELAEASGSGRSVVRGMLASLQAKGVVERAGRRWILRKALPTPPSAGVTSKRERAKAFLVAELGRGGLHPGDQLSELALAKKAGVSTVSMREALLEMIPLGMLTKKERQQWEVASFSEDRVREMREFREMVELFCLRKLLDAGPSQDRKRAFQQVQSETRAVLGEQSPAISKILRVDLAFHRQLLESAGNSLLRERADFIYLIIEFLLVSPFYSREAGTMGLRQHLKILKAILSRDRATAESALREHLRSSERVFLDVGNKSQHG